MSEAGKRFIIIALLLAAVALAQQMLLAESYSDARGTGLPDAPAAMLAAVPDTPHLHGTGAHVEQSEAVLEGLTEPAPPEDAAPAPALVPAEEDAAPPARPRQYTRRMRVTAYCPCTICCGSNARGVTASGLNVRHNGGRFVAADTSVLPFHTRLSIPGYHGGQAVPVIDRGGAIKGDRLDVYFPDHATARQWGVRWLDVTVYQD